MRRLGEQKRAAHWAQTYQVYSHASHSFRVLTEVGIQRVAERAGLVWGDAMEKVRFSAGPALFFGRDPNSFHTHVLHRVH